MKYFFINVVVFFILSGFCIKIQSQDSLTINLKSEARQHFLEKNYKNALPLYLELLKSFPGEPEFQFSTGVCLVSLNKDLPEAIRLLRAVSVANYSSMSWFYLGRAQHLY
jgi:predicted Zn-dependent protease